MWISKSKRQVQGFVQPPNFQTHPFGLLCQVSGLEAIWSPQRLSKPGRSGGYQRYQKHQGIPVVPGSLHQNPRLRNWTKSGHYQSWAMALSRDPPSALLAHPWHQEHPLMLKMGSSGNPKRWMRCKRATRNLNIRWCFRAAVWKSWELMMTGMIPFMKPLKQARPCLQFILHSY